MTLAFQHEQIAQLPCGEQLQRLKKLGRHLRMFIGRYRYEPQTEVQFQRREMLREGLRAMEDTCTRLSAMQKEGKEVLETIQLELRKLRADFYRLEEQVHNYTAER